MTGLELKVIAEQHGVAVQVHPIRFGHPVLVTAAAARDRHSEVTTMAESFNVDAAIGSALNDLVFLLRMDGNPCEWAMDLLDDRGEFPLAQVAS